IMRDMCADFGAELAESSGQAQHVHLLVTFPPTVASSRLVNSLKDVSSRRLRQEFPGLRRATGGRNARVRVLLRRVGRRTPHLRPAPLH
ncbi:MAG: IS200/IS605 family transposase, partial [Streptosporangiales bacterium]